MKHTDWQKISPNVIWGQVCPMTSRHNDTCMGFFFYFGYNRCRELILDTHFVQNVTALYEYVSIQRNKYRASIRRMWVSLIFMNVMYLHSAHISIWRKENFDLSHFIYLSLVSHIMYDKCYNIWYLTDLNGIEDILSTFS